jgi:glycerophosphoryl diester phosphodiesterase
VSAGGIADLATPGRALRLAHRGHARGVRENTLPAFLAALAVPGCDGLELDVRLSSDGVAVCSHDDTLQRVFGVDRRVDALTAAELTAVGLSTLEAVLTGTPSSAFLDVELKGNPGRAAVETLRVGRGPGLDRAVVSSFDTAALTTVAELEPSWPRWLNAGDASAASIATALELGCQGISVNWSSLDEQAVDAARAAGLVVAAWTVTRRADLDRLGRIGVTAACIEGEALTGRTWRSFVPRRAVALVRSVTATLAARR